MDKDSGDDEDDDDELQTPCVMATVHVTISSKQRKRSLNGGDKNTASLITEPNKRNVITLFKKA